MVNRTCERCRRPFTAVNSSARFCSASCRAMAAKDRSKGRGVAPVTTVTPVTTPDAQPESSISVLEAVRRKLDAAGEADSPAGRMALTMAARADSGQDSGSALAALMKQLAVTLEDAVGRVVAGDPIDEVREARERRRRAG